MTLQEYYNTIISKYNSGDYKIRIAKHMQVTPEINQKEFTLHAMNYLIFEYLKDNHDSRWKLLIDYVLIPNGVNRGDCNIDFTQVSFQDFFDFMVSVKS